MAEDKRNAPRPIMAKPIKAPDVVVKKVRALTPKAPGALNAALLALTGVCIGLMSVYLSLQLVLLRATSKAELDRIGSTIFGFLSPMAVITVVLLVVQGILLVIWIHRMNRNCHAFGARGMRFTPGWSAGWCFVPIANLIRPHQVVKEISQASDTPADWQGCRGSALVDFWWVLFISSCVLGPYVSYRFRSAGTFDVWKHVAFQWALSQACWLATEIVMLLMVVSMSRKQQRLIDNAVAPVPVVPIEK